MEREEAFKGRFGSISWTGGSSNGTLVEGIRRCLVSSLPAGARAFGMSERRSDGEESSAVVFSLQEEASWPDAAEKFAVTGTRHCKVEAAGSEGLAGHFLVQKVANIQLSDLHRAPTKWTTVFLMDEYAGWSTAGVDNYRLVTVKCAASGVNVGAWLYDYLYLRRGTVSV